MMETQTEATVRAVLDDEPKVLVAILFGSAARGELRPDSDVDLAVASADVLTPQDKLRLIERLAQACGRPVDLVDLWRAPPLLLRQILTAGCVLLKRDSQPTKRIYAELICRIIYQQTDFVPYLERILAERRERAFGA